jgi:hypothetical protein
VTQHGLEYPGFYRRLYALLTPQAFLATHRWGGRMCRASSPPGGACGPWQPGASPPPPPGPHRPWPHRCPHRPTQTALSPHGRPHTSLPRLAALLLTSASWSPAAGPSSSSWQTSSLRRA